MQVEKEKILVVLPNHLGDVVMATPALRSLRAGHPDAQIAVLVRERLAGVLGGCPWIDRIHTHTLYETSRGLRRILRRIALGRAFRGASSVVVLPNSFSGALLAVATGAPRRIGYRRGGRAWLLSDALPPPRENGRPVPVAMERYYLDLVRPLGCPDTGTGLELFTEPEAEAACERLLASHGIDGERPLVCLAPGAGYGPAKIWPLPYVAEFAAKLQADGVALALVHGPGEEALADEICARCSPPPARLGGEAMDLARLKSVISRASLLVCNDAGARHIAAAFRVPALVLMGPTSLRYTNLNLERTRLLREPVECSPCQLKVCPIDHRCMTRLRPSRVLEEARAALRDESWRGDVELELRS
ncbi:MAG: lipopolysaccharide heptosyltransferase II [Myxococcota bacterium]